MTQIKVQSKNLNFFHKCQIFLLAWEKKKKKPEQNSCA